MTIARKHEQQTTFADRPNDYRVARAARALQLEWTLVERVLAVALGGAATPAQTQVIYQKFAAGRTAKAV